MKDLRTEHVPDRLRGADLPEEPLPGPRCRTRTPSTGARSSSARSGSCTSATSGAARIRAEPGRRPPGVTSATDVAHHVLDAGVVLEAVHRQVLAVAGVLEPAVRHLGDERDVGVDPHARRSRAAWPSRIARPWSVVHTLDARPYSTPLAQRTASSSSVKRCTVMTGPKISSWTISSSWLQAGHDGRREEVAARRRPGAPPVDDLGVVRDAGRGSRSTRASWFGVVQRAEAGVRRRRARRSWCSLACSASAATKSSWTPRTGEHAGRRGAVLARR